MSVSGSAQIQFPSFSYFGKVGPAAVFHPAHGGHECRHVMRIARVQRLLCFESGQGAYLTDVEIRVVAVFGRRPSCDDFLYGVQSVFTVIRAQHDKSRSVSPCHAVEAEEVRVVLFRMQSLPDGCAFPYVQRIAVAQSSGCTVQLPAIRVIRRFHRPEWHFRRSSLRPGC